MKKITQVFVAFTILFCMSFNLTAQEEKPAEKPIRPAFQSSYLIDNQTTYMPVKGTLEMILHHRFGPTENGSSDLWGIYAPSNIRMGFNYSLLDNVMVGIGTTKFRKYQDLHYKAILLTQTRSGSIPVSVALYGDFAIDARDEAVFGTEYEFTHRFSYFNQIIISRKFNHMFSLQVAPSYSHFNMVEEGYQNRYLGFSINGRAQISPQTSIIFNYDSPIEIDGLLIKGREGIDGTFTHELPKANIGIGVEIATSTHAFHIFVASGQGILPQDNMVFNRNDFFDGGMLFGFNLTRLWSW